MNKLKMLVLAALTAATVGVGALAAAPSASARESAYCPSFADQLAEAAEMAEAARTRLREVGSWL
jgi:hypothetical protein